MEPKGFPTNPVLLTMLIGMIIGIVRGMSVRKQQQSRSAREQMEEAQREW